MFMPQENTLAVILFYFGTVCEVHNAAQ